PTLDLYYADVTKPRTLVIRDFQYRDFDTLMVYQSRLYWLRHKMRLPDQTMVPTHLLSANLDGSDRKTVLDLEQRRLEIYAPQVYQGNLYCVAYRPLPPGKHEGASPPPQLCRLHPERADPIEVLHAVEGEVMFDEGYCYCSTRTPTRSLWDTLTDDY